MFAVGSWMLFVCVVAGTIASGIHDRKPAAQAHRDKFGRVIVSEKDRIYELTSRIEQLEIKLEGTRNYLDETKPWFDDATLSIAKIHDRLDKLEAPETFPEPND
jgi:tetrahydromethanopterin S-methyltransferase subunit G